MPEGPSIVILKEEVQAFKGKTITAASGNTKKIDIGMLQDKQIIDFQSWGKHFLICFKNFTVKIHFLLFGSYRINERKDSEPRLSLQFEDGELNFYTCSVSMIEGSLDKLYDWTADVLNAKWNPELAREKLKKKPQTLVCDILLDQNIFSGVGNIIKNEVLYRIKIHPNSIVGNLPPEQTEALIEEAVKYSFDFLKWKKEYSLRAHWLAHTKKICKRCDLPMHKEYLGKTNRRTFFCNNCQVLY